MTDLTRERELRERAREIVAEHLVEPVVVLIQAELASARQAALADAGRFILDTCPNKRPCSDCKNRAATLQAGVLDERAQAEGKVKE